MRIFVAQMKTLFRKPFLLLPMAAGVCLTLMPAIRLYGQTVSHIAGGGAHSLFSKSDGSLWVMGDNSVGQLGIGFALGKTNVPQEVLSNGVGLVAAGSQHSLLQIGRALWSMGDNRYGQLGDGTLANHYFPEQVYSAPFRFGVGPIAAGDFHSLFGDFPQLSGGGAFWVMGYNGYGQLGDGTSNSTNKPEELLVSIAGATVIAVAGGSLHSLFVTPNGRLWAMGANYLGQLGNGNTYATNTPQMIVSSGVTAVAAGFAHSLFIKSDGSLWATGDDGSGELGDNYAAGEFAETPEQVQFNGVIAVVAGGTHSLFIKSDGSLWGMGDNSRGQLGNGTTNNSGLPIQIVASNVVAVAAGAYHNLFIKSDGSLWGMGANDSGQLGDGTYTDSLVPEEIVPPPPPTITSIVVSGPDVVVSWPTNQGGFQLQGSPVLGPSASWSAVSPGAVIVSNQYLVTTPISSSNMFFRLGE
jgi:alpha-tubulin suppressor-like RCC1 family protein